MLLNAIAIYVLLGLSSLLGVQAVPSRGGTAWQIIQPWTLQDNINQFVASSSEIAEECRRHGDWVVQFPQVIHGTHDIFADGRKVLTFGDSSFRSTKSFFGSPVVKCKDLAGSHSITWKVYCYAQYFARFSAFPEVVPTMNHSNLFSETLSLVATGSLLAVTIVALIIFFGKVPNSLVTCLAFSGPLLAVYFILGSAELFDIRIPMLEAHRYADLGVLAGLSSFLYGLVHEKVIRKSHFQIYLGFVIASALIMICATTGDSIQLGTSLAFGPIIAISAVGAFGQLRIFFNEGRERRQAFAFVSLSLFLAGCINEIFVISGVGNTYTVSSVCCVFGFLFYTFSVNERVVQAYLKLNFLQNHLETEVARKTNLLEGALQELRDTQSELVQSAKLASLGTLSAGIAHEINNSLNYVNGSIKPIERLLVDLDLGPKRPKIDLLFKTANEGLTLTFGIIKSLRNYTGLNQAKFNQVDILETTHGVCTLINSKLKKVVIELSIPTGLSIYGSVVGINQILMNLIDNAVDAMDGEGKIIVQASANQQCIVINVTDSGKGMSPATIDRIFEPFFTTKEVGKGTGLGLHIVRMEMEKHKGKLSVHSVENQGTTFSLEFPVVDFATGSMSA